MADVVQLLKGLDGVVELNTDGKILWTRKEVGTVGLNDDLKPYVPPDSSYRMIAASDKYLFTLLNDGSVAILLAQGSTIYHDSVNLPSSAHAVQQSKGRFYTLHADGKLLVHIPIWREGTPHGFLTKLLDENEANYCCAADGDQVYVLRTDGIVYHKNGIEGQWEAISPVRASISVVAAGGKVYHFSWGGEIWLYSGVPMQWTRIADYTPDIRGISAIDDRLYKYVKGGNCFLYNNSPNSWTSLGNINSITPEELGIQGASSFADASPPDGFRMLLDSAGCLFGVGAVAAGMFATEGLAEPALQDIFIASGALTACVGAAYEAYQFYSYTPPVDFGLGIP